MPALAPVILNLCWIAGALWFAPHFDVPIMAVGYLLGTIAVLVVNYQHIPGAIVVIFASAFGADSIFGGIIGAAVAIVFQSLPLGGVIATAMMANIVLAGLAGVLVPLALERAGADPAVSSSVFVTMTTDSMGFLVFLGLAVTAGLVG